MKKLEYILAHVLGILSMGFIVVIFVYGFIGVMKDVFEWIDWASRQSP